MTQDDGGPAFPRAMHDTPLHGKQGGMSLRDWLAGQALVGYASNMETVKKGTDWMVRHAYIAADAMLLARKEPSR